MHGFENAVRKLKIHHFSRCNFRSKRTLKPPKLKLMPTTPKISWGGPRHSSAQFVRWLAQHAGT
jgi:hypothetical protein